MYTTRNTHPDAPGQWTTADGEYEFTRLASGWQARHRASFDSPGVIGSGPTLASVLALATRHAVTPVGQWQT